MEILGKSQTKDPDQFHCRGILNEEYGSCRVKCMDSLVSTGYVESVCSDFWSYSLERLSTASVMLLSLDRSFLVSTAAGVVVC